MKWIIQSRAYRKAKRLVSTTIESPAKLLSLANSAQQKAAKQASDKLADLIDPIKASYRLIRAYASGAYRDISLENFGLIVAIFQGAMFGFLEKIKITESLVAYVYYFYAISLLLFLDSYAYFLPQLIQTSIFLFVFGYFFNKPMSRKDI